MPWQRHVADVALELLPDGTLAYDEVVLTVPRQAGKTTLLLPVFVHRCIANFAGGRLDSGPQPQSVIYTAQSRNDARKKWVKEFVPLLERSPFRQQFTKRLTNGSEGLDWVNDSTFDLIATTEKSGHGDTLDLGIIDEAFAQVDGRLEQAMEPATITRVSSQLWVVSTAGWSPVRSPFLWRKVETGRRLVTEGAPSTTAFFEWSVGDDEDWTDVEVVASRHPAIGHTQTVADLDAKYRKALAVEESNAVGVDGDDGLAGYRRAYCNMWGAVGSDVTPKIPADGWKATTIAADAAPEVLPGEPSLCWAVSLDGEWSTIGIGHGAIDGAYVEVIEHRRGQAWLPGRLVELIERWDPIAVGANNAGPTAASVPNVMVAMADAGISADRLHLFTMGEWKTACGGLFAAVREGQVRHPEGQAPLDAAVAAASERKLGDGFAWDARATDVALSPLDVVTGARALLPVEVEVHVDVAANVW